MDLKAVALSAVLGAVGGVAGSVYYLGNQLNDYENKLSLTPPTMVVDFAQLAMAYPEGASPEDVDALMVQTNNAVMKLKEAGYLVLDSSAVVVAPEDVYLPADIVDGLVE